MHQNFFQLLLFVMLETYYRSRKTTTIQNIFINTLMKETLVKTIFTFLLFTFFY